MCDQPDLDVDSLRSQHESPTEWNLRRKFLMAHKDHLPLATLLCMASCFINIELSGCRYPPAVMDRVRDLAEAVKDDVESHRTLVKERTEVKFVKVLDSSQPGTSKIGTGSSNSSLPPFELAKGKTRPGFGSSSSATSKVTGGISFIKSDDKYSTTSESLAKGPSRARKAEPLIDLKFQKYQQKVKEYLTKDERTDCMSLLHMAAQKAAMNVSVTFSSIIDGQYNAKVLLDFVLAAEAKSANKKAAKRQAAENAVHLLCKTHLRIVAVGPDEFKFEGSDKPFDVVEDEPQEPPHLYPQHQKDQVIETDMETGSFTDATEIPDFVLHEHERTTLSGAVATLSQTGRALDIPVEYSYGTHQGNILCSLQIGNIYEGKGLGKSQKEARKDAAEVALQELRKKYYTVQTKSRADDEDGVSIGGKVDDKNVPLPDSNVGNKLLKMMGWAGGGIGKEGQGIAEPVSLDGVINREGLGLGTATGITPNFKQKVQHMLEDYIQCEDRKDLVFTPDLTNEERKFIHHLGKKMGLKTKSYNRNQEERYLVVSKKMSWTDTFQSLVECGGENKNFRLIPPGMHEEG